MGATEGEGGLLMLVETREGVVGCSGCGTRARSKGRCRTRVRDLPTGGRPDHVGAVVAWTDGGVQSVFGGYGPVQIEADIRDPGLVIVGGGLTNASGLLERLGHVALQAVWSDHARETPILAATCGRSAGVIGAGLALLDFIAD